MSIFHLGEDGDEVGAHRQADRATHERSHSTVSSPCGECPLRGALDEIGRHLLAIDLEGPERKINDAYDVFFNTLSLAREQ